MMKRFFVWSIVFIMSLSGAVNALAEEAVPEIPPANDKPVAGYKNGFFIQSPDGRNQLKIKGRFQPRVQYNNKTVNNIANTWTFLIRRVRLDFSGVLFEKANFALTLQHSTKSSTFNTVNITGVTFGYEFCPEFAITTGMVGMPLSIIGSRSSAGYFLLEPPIVQTQIDGQEADGTAPVTVLRSSFGNPSGLGIEFTGSFGKFNYDISVVNGAAEANLATGAGGEESDYDLNFNNKVSSGARFSYNILESAEGGMEGDFPYSEKARWTISVGGNYQGKRVDPNVPGGQNIKYILTGSAGTSFKWRGFAINADAFGRKTKLNPPYNNLTDYSVIMDDFGYYVDMGYFVIPNKLELAVLGSQIFREGPNNNSYQYGGGVNWYIDGNNLKMQLAYSLSSYFADITTTRYTKSTLLGLMLTAAF